MKFDYKKVLILGYGKSGHAVEEVLYANSIDYLIYDQKIDIDTEKFVSKLSKKILKGIDIAVLSPGISIYSKVVKRLCKYGIKVISEIEFAYYFCDSQVIAVTGTNGKTTTATLIHHILTSAGINSSLLGNVGTPFSNIYRLDSQVAVVEVSSFQLEAIEQFKPNIAILLNIAHDHIERHGSMENYINTKFEIFRNQTAMDHAIVSRSVSGYSNMDSIRSNIYTINANGINIEDDTVYIYDDGEKYKVCDKSIVDAIDTCIDNVLSSVLACFLYGISIRDIVSALNSFVLPRHRCEVVCEMNGVTYINDSKSTNVHSMEYAIKSLKTADICLMLGGFDKKLDFSVFISHMPYNIKQLVLFGPAGKRISKVCRKYGYDKYVVFENLMSAINYVKANIKANTTVLFSPANSSFDEFDSYVERGEFFVNNIRGSGEKVQTK